MGKSSAVTWILAAALAVAVVIIAFLMGKESGRGDPGAAAVRAAPAVTAGTPPGSIGAPAVDDSAALRAYFAEVESIQIGPAGNADSFAQELISASLRGERGKLDQLVRDLAGAEAEVRGIASPASAKAHHQALITQVGESRRVMGKVAQALGNNDPGALSQLAAEASGLQAAAEALEREEKALKKRAGM